MLIMRRNLLASVLFFSLLHPAQALADETFSLELGSSMAWGSEMPQAFDVQLDPQVHARAVLDLSFAAVDATYRVADPTRPELFQLRGTAHLSVLTLHELTWRRSERLESLRIMAGLGGNMDLPADLGSLWLSVGFAMTRQETANDPAAFFEAYGAYAGFTSHLRLGPVHDELRVAVHATTPPPELDLGLVFDLSGLFTGLEAGVTVQNRLYVPVLEEGPVSIGPELVVRYEQLHRGPVVLATLGLAGHFGI